MADLTDFEAEQALIGSFLLGVSGAATELMWPEAWPSCAALVSVEDFTDWKHRTLWRAFMRLKERGDPIDCVSVRGELRAMGETKIGWADLAHLGGTVPTAYHAAHYARIVADLGAKRRALQRVQDEAVARAKTALEHPEVGRRYQV